MQKKANYKLRKNKSVYRSILQSTILLGCSKLFWLVDELLLLEIPYLHTIKMIIIQLIKTIIKIESNKHLIWKSSLSDSYLLFAEIIA